MRRDFNEEDIGHKTIIVVNKSDEIEHRMKKKSLSIVTESGRKKVDMLISARDEKDVEELLRMIGKKMEEDFGLYKDNADEVYFTRQRYFEKLEKCNQLLNAYITEDRPDISCEYLRRAIAEIGDMFGRVDAEDVLDVLFSEFCIGK
jgi:tRNA modification GTPase